LQLNYIGSSYLNEINQKASERKNHVAAAKGEAKLVAERVDLEEKTHPMQREYETTRLPAQFC